MPTSVVGRDAELAALEDFLVGIADGASVLVLEGEAGMGKTTLWRAGVCSAEDRGVRVLQALPAESETALSFSGLGDLLDVVLDEALEPLPAGQRLALSRALLLEDAEDALPDARAVGVALLGVLRSLSEEGPLVVAVDDVQWLDAASVGALEYATRRLREEPVGVLLARRSGLESAIVDELFRVLGTRVGEVTVGPLDPRGLHRVVSEHLGASLPRPLLAEVHQAAGGNPFYALEIVRQLQRTGVSVEAGQPLPVPDSLHELVDGRLRALPPETRDLLLAAAAHAHPTVAITESATGIACAAGLLPALEARVVELDRERIRFTHPLLAAGAYEIADPLRRREIHARLAELLDDPEARAWQLAASVEQPDESVAAALEEAAAHARARGAPRPAALLLNRASLLTPSERHDDLVRRAVDGAYLHFEAGDSVRATTALAELIDTLPAGPERAQAMLALGRTQIYEGSDEAAELFREVIETEGADPETLARAHEGLASWHWYGLRLHGLDEAVAHAEVALSLAVELDDDALAADILMVYLGAEALLGRGTASATADRALALQDVVSDRRLLDQPLTAVAEYWIWTDACERARTELVNLLRRADELGDESSRPYLLFNLGEAACLLGELDLALECARAGQEAAEQSGGHLLNSAHNRALESLVEAVLGHAEDVRRLVPGILERAPQSYAGLLASAALGHLELSLGAPAAAVAHLERPVAFVRQEGIVEPSVTRFAVDHIEALIELGRVGDALELLDWYERNTRRLERASALANCARCRGLVAAHAGKLDEALACFAQALEWHEKVKLPLDHGRTLLALGATLRRAKRRREARSTLEEALSAFERIGASLWADRARAELKRISGRAATPGALTPAEERVAALVAEGKTNKEVAAALFLSDRTVEGHLAHIFGKLGIRHRSEIASVLARTQTQGSTSSNTGGSPVSAESSAP
jgi:DNA-binding CsgD family transcriptional regulator